MFGALAGYLTSDLDFRNSPNSFQYKGATVGLYGTYINGGFYADVLLKADLLDMKWKAPTLNGSSTREPRAQTRTPTAPGWIWATVTRSRRRGSSNPQRHCRMRRRISTRWRSPAATSGSTGSRCAARLACAWTGFQMSATTQLEASLTGRVWNEFDGDNRAAIVNAGPTFFATDKFDGAYGEVVGLLNVFNAGSGWSGFANLGVKFNGDFTTTTAKAGLRYVWGAAPPAAPAPVVLSVRN